MDCVRLARLGLIEGFEAELVVSGINHGANLGDDITYSGTVAAALEAIVLGLPGIAVSQQSGAREPDFISGAGFEFDSAAAFTARLVARARGRAAPVRHAPEHQRARDASPSGVEVARLGKRVYRDELTLVDEGAGARRLYRIYGEALWESGEDGHRPGGRGGRQDRGDADPLRPHRPGGPVGAAALRPGAADRLGGRGGDRRPEQGSRPRRARGRAAQGPRSPRLPLLRPRRPRDRRRPVRRADRRAAPDRSRSSRSW